MLMLVFDLSPDDNLLSFDTFVLAVDDGEIVCMVGLFGVYILYLSVHYYNMSKLTYKFCT